MAARGMKGACLAAGGLVALLLAGTPAPAQERIRAISVFPDPETTGVFPGATISEPPGFSRVAGAAIAGTLMFPFMTARCLSGDVLGFLVGSVFRVPVSALTLGDRAGIGGELDRLGAQIVGYTCSQPLFVSPEDFIWPAASPEPAAAVPPEAN